MIYFIKSDILLLNDRKLPLKAFSRMVVARRALHKVKDFTCLDQFLDQSTAQMTASNSLRDIEKNLRLKRQHFYHLSFRCKTISRKTLANANSKKFEINQKGIKWKI